MTTEATTQQNRARGKRRSAVLLSLALGAALAAIVAMTGVAREAEAAFPGANGRIAFESDRTSGKGVNNPAGDVEIFAMNRDGTGVTQLTNNTADDFDPSYSAKGEVILFSTNRDGNIEIYVMDSDGTDSDVPVAVRNLSNVRNMDGGYEFTLVALQRPPSCPPRGNGSARQVGPDGERREKGALM